MDSFLCVGLETSSSRKKQSKPQLSLPDDYFSTEEANQTDQVGASGTFTSLKLLQVLHLFRHVCECCTPMISGWKVFMLSAVDDLRWTRKAGRDQWLMYSSCLSSTPQHGRTQELKPSLTRRWPALRSIRVQDCCFCRNLKGLPHALSAHGRPLNVMYWSWLWPRHRDFFSLWLDGKAH